MYYFFFKFLFIFNNVYMHGVYEQGDPQSPGALDALELML